MRFKRDDGGSEPSGVRFLSHRAKESLVAEVNAVEISDGDCAGAFVRGAGKAADNLHAGLLDEGCLNDGQGPARSI